MLPLPVRQRRATGTRAVGTTVRVDARACPQILPAFAELARRAWGLEILAADDASDVVLVEGVPDAPPAKGRDPRVGDRVGASEAYRIDVGESARIVAAGPEAWFRGLVTWAASASAGAVAEVADHPRWAWRGLMLDVVRRWFTVAEVKAVIDLLAVHKMNVLHLHLTDTQAWRFSVPGYPEAASEERYSEGDLADLERYAADRFVTIVPEIDIPGHVPATLAAMGIPVVSEEHPVLSYLDAADEATLAFLRAAFGELSRIFPSPHLHLGGDEAFGAPEAAYRRSVRAVVDIVRSLGRIPCGWQESIRAEALRPGDLAQLWIAERDRFDVERAKAVAPEKFHPLVERAGELFALSTDDPARIGAARVGVIVSSSDPLYLDRRPSDESRDDEQNVSMRRLGNPAYPATSTTSVLSWEPEAQADIAAAGVRVEGIEAALWCETVESFDDAALLLLPRLALIAQRAWGGADADLDAVIAAAAASAESWTRLGFANHHRSSEIFRS